MKKAALIISGIGLLVILLTVSGWLLLKARIASQLDGELSRALNASPQYSSLSVNPLAGEIRILNGRLTSRDPAAHWQRASFAQVGVTFKFLDIFSPVIPLTVTVNNAEIILQTPAADADLQRTAEPISPPAAVDRWPRLRAQTVSVNHLSLRHATDATFTATGLYADIELAPNQTAHTGTVSGATLRVGALTLTELTGRFIHDERGLLLEKFRTVSGSGEITGSAALPRNNPASIEFHLNRVPASVLLNEKWSVIISGLASGAGTYTGDPFAWRSGEATGSLTLEQAAFKAPPFLLPAKQLLGLPVTAGDLALDEARADFRYTAGDLSLTDLHLAKNNLFALRGTASVSDSVLNGSLRLGLPAIVPLPPRLKAEVFTTESDGWQWAPFTISGTPGQWQEDLSSRTVQAIGNEGRQLFDQVKDKARENLDKARQKAGEWLDQILGH